MADQPNPDNPEEEIDLKATDDAQTETAMDADAFNEVTLENTVQTEFGKVMTTPISSEMQRFYLDYAMSVIVSRALPDVRDGLKPVHRRILYAMHKDLNLLPPAKYRKCATIVGEVLGKYHPHGDGPVYEALVRLAQEFSLRYPLVDGQGNFGSIDGDSAAAMRYTECRLDKISRTLLQDIEKATVNMNGNFDNTISEPEVLPAVLPNLLLMGAEGIAVGMATKIPPHNLTEICSGIKAMITKGQTIILQDPKTLTTTDGTELGSAEDDELQNLLRDAKPDVPWKTPIPNPKVSYQSDISLDELMEHIPGPDMPTAGYLFDKKIIRDVYATGRGSMPMRAKTETEEIKGGRTRIVVTELPYQVNKANLVSKIADLVKDKKIEGISDLRDESDRTGIRVVIELKKDARPKSLLNSLYKYTQLQQNFPANMVALVDGTPQLLGLKTILLEYIKHRQSVIIRRSQFDLRNARYRAHILEGLKIALDNIDEIIATIRSSKDTETAKANLMKKFGLSEIQSVAILDMQLRRLSGLERQKIDDEYKEVMAFIDYLEDLLLNPEKIITIIGDELTELIENFGDERRTVIVPQGVGDFNEEDLIPKEKTVITITHTGYVKRLAPDTFRSQRRGGKGVSGMTTKTEDDIHHVCSAETHDHILFFTDKGRVFKLKVWELPEGSRQAKGSALINLLNIDQNEQVESILTINQNDFSDKSQYILLATRRGMVKKTSLADFANIRTSGIIAIKLSDNDQLVWAALTSGKDDIVMVSHAGKSIRFPETDIRPTGRATMGVVGMKLPKKEDYVVGMEVIPSNYTPPEDGRRKAFRNILVVMEKGLGKQTPIEQFPVQKRGGQGVKVANVTAKTGQIVSGRLVTEKVEHILLTTKSAQVIKLPLKNIPTLSRPTQGVILMRPKSGDYITATAILRPEEDEDLPPHC